MKRILVATVAVLAVGVAAHAQKPAPAKAANPSCPIMKHAVAKVDAKLTSTYKGKKFFFCCGGCKPTFDKMTDKDKLALMKYGVAEKPAKKAAPAPAPKKAA